MITRLKGKRLLVLGGSIWKQAIKDFADSNGIIIISAGLYPAGTDDIANEVYRIDTTQADLMIPFIKEHNIDGVYMGGSELVISSACQWINQLNLPCYCTKEQWDFLQNKRNFKDLCVKFGLPVAPRYQIDEKDISHSVPMECYPVITKPEDGCGSNGFSVCRTSEELERGYNRAAENSPTRSVICEKYVKNDAVVAFYTFSKGESYFSGLEDKIPVKFRKQGTYIGGLYCFESDYAEEFRHRFEDKLRRLFHSIGISEGSIWIEVFHDGDDYYFNEVGFRYGGTVSTYPVDYFYGYNQVAADIYYALTGESRIEGHSSLIPVTLPRKKYYAIYPVDLWPGTIAEISGVEKIEKNENVVRCFLTKRVGNAVPDSGSFNQVFALVHFVYNTIDELGDMLRFVHQTLRVTSDNGKDMILKMLDFDAIEIQAFNNQVNTPPYVCVENNESLADWFRRRMFDVRIYGGTSFRKQYEDAINTFLTKEQLSNERYLKTIGDDIIDAYVKFKMRPRDYFYFGFQGIDDTVRNTYLTETLEDSTLIEITGWNKYLYDLTDKWRFYELAKPFFCRAVMKFDEKTAKREFVEFALKVRSLFIKPLDGSEGDGAFTVAVVNEDDAEHVYDRLSKTKFKWMVEEKIQQTAEMAAWNASSVNTVRIPSFLNKNGHHILGPIFRCGRNNSCVDNVSAGGLFSLIDEKTGQLKSDGLDVVGGKYTEHPETGKVFYGWQIPRWQELVKMVESVHRTFPTHIYIAWDFALTDNGWDLIEGNWGRLRAAQIALRKGIKKEFLEYMNGGSIL